MKKLITYILLLFVIMLLILLTACSKPMGGDLDIIEIDKITIKPLKIDKSRILFSKERKYKVSKKLPDGGISEEMDEMGTTTFYYFVTYNKVKKDKLKDKLNILYDEDEFSRDFNKKVYPITATTVVSAIYPGLQMAKDLITQEWFYVDFGTTTPENYAKHQVATTTSYYPFYDTIKDIIVGKPVHAVESPFYPDPHTESTSVDGRVRNYRSGTWSSLHDDSDGDTADDTSTNLSIEAGHVSGTGWFLFYRSFYLFDTSSLSTDTITSATLSLYGTAIRSDPQDSSITIVQSSPASNIAIVVDDFDQCGSHTDPAEGTDSPIDIADWNIAGYNVFPLNNLGLTWIDDDGISKFGEREKQYDAEDDPVSSGERFSASSYHSENPGTDKDPLLLVTQSVGGVVSAPEYSSDETMLSL